MVTTRNRRIAARSRTSLAALLCAVALAGCASQGSESVEGGARNDGLTVPIPPSAAALAALPAGSSVEDLLITADDCWSLETGDLVEPLMGADGLRICQ